MALWEGDMLFLLFLFLRNSPCDMAELLFDHFCQGLDWHIILQKKKNEPDWIIARTRVDFVLWSFYKNKVSDLSQYVSP